MEKQYVLFKALDWQFDSRHYLGEVLNASHEGAWVRTPDAAEPPHFVTHDRVLHSFGEPSLLPTITRFWTQNPGKRLVSYLN